MPLAKDQIETLKREDAKIVIQNENLKKTGSKTWDRINQYEMAKTIGDAMRAGANWQDLSSDFEEGFLKFQPENLDGDESMPGPVKRSAPEGTPDRETQTRAKVQSGAVVSQVLMPEAVEPIQKVAMNAATIAALRGMMRDEIKNGMLEMEERFNKHVAASSGALREEFNEEKTARKTLGQRLAALEEREFKPWSTPQGARRSCGQVGCCVGRLR